jgi:hypothetical protein
MVLPSNKEPKLPRIFAFMGQAFVGQYPKSFSKTMIHGTLFELFPESSVMYKSLFGTTGSTTSVAYSFFVCLLLLLYRFYIFEPWALPYCVQRSSSVTGNSPFLAKHPQSYQKVSIIDE